MSEVTHSLGTANGDLPLDHLERTITELVTTATALREREDVIRAELDKVKEQRQRIDRAVNALTAPKPEPKQYKSRKPGPKRADRQPGFVGDPVTNAAPNYPGVSEVKQDEVLRLLKSFGRPVAPRDIIEHPEYNMAKSTTQNALAHLRARGLVRWAGKSQGGGHKYAAFESGDEDES
jgi:hypothetical protein